MTLYSEFKDRNDVTWNLEISNSGGGEADVLLGGTPVVISSSSSRLFSPIKSRAMTIELYSKQWYFDLYEPTSRGTKVKLYSGNDIVFRGYLTPCSYDQSFTYVDTIQLEAVDAVSTCKDFKWMNDGTYKSFFDIVIGILASAGYRGSLYVPRSYSHINGVQKSGDIMSELYASSVNFIDDDEAKTPWTEYEVLEEIMKFLGWSLCPYGDDVWLIDYRAENAGSVTYSQYDIQTHQFVSTVSSAASPTAITLDDMAAGESEVSIDDIYNKIEISDNLYKIEELSPDIFDDANHISITEERDLGVDESQWTKTTTRKFLFWTRDNYSQATDTEQPIGVDYQTVCRLKPESGWHHRYYRFSDLTERNNDDGQGYFDEALYLNPDNKYKAGKINSFCNTHGCLMQHYAHVDNPTSNALPATVDWTDLLTFFVMGPNMKLLTVGTLTDLELPVLEYTIDEEIQWKPASGTSWLCIKGSLLYQTGGRIDKKKKKNELTIINDKENYYTTCPVDKAVSNLPSDKPYGNVWRTRSQQADSYGLGFRIWKMRLQIGEDNEAKYWTEAFNSSTNQYVGTWTSVPSDFYIRFNNNPQYSDKPKDDIEMIPEFQWCGMVNNMNYKDKVGVDGYCIKIDSEDDNAPSFGKMKLTVYTPSLLPQELIQALSYLEETYNWMTGSFGFNGSDLAPVIYCKDFGLEYVYTDTTVWYNNHEDENNADKVYVGYINDNYVNTFDTLEFKLNTAIKDKPISRSFVSTSNGYLDTMKHIVGNESKAQEYNVIDEYLDHHSERRVIFNRNMHGLFKPNEKFSKTQFSGNLMIDSYSFDVRNNNNDIKFIEF